MKYRYIPFEVEAERWDLDNLAEDSDRIMTWLKEKGYVTQLITSNEEDIYYILVFMAHTINIAVNPGEWVIKDKDSLGVYTDEDFHKMFESIKENANGMDT